MPPRALRNDGALHAVAPRGRNALLWPVADVADALALHRSNVLRMLYAGKLEGIKRRRLRKQPDGRMFRTDTWFITDESLQRYIRGEVVRPATPGRLRGPGT